LIVKTLGSTEMIIQYPFVKTQYNSIPFCEVVPKKIIATKSNIKYYNPSLKVKKSSNTKDK
jgi:hypothetical protein